MRRDTETQCVHLLSGKYVDDDDDGVCVHFHLEQEFNILKTRLPCLVVCYVYITCLRQFTFSHDESEYYIQDVHCNRASFSVFFAPS